MPSVAAVALAALLVAFLPAGTVGRLGAPPRLCADDIVRETCALLDATGGDRATLAALREIFAATEPSVQAFWRDAGLHPKGAASCAELCGNAVAYLASLGRQLPPRSDLGCYEAGGGATACDLDLGAEALQAMAASFSDLPLYADEEPVHGNSLARVDDDASVPTFEYTAEELAVRVAQIFRIYPAQETKLRLEKNAGATLTPAERELLARRLLQSRAFLSVALRTFPTNKTVEATRLYFGDAALVTPRTRQRIIQVLNSVDIVIFNASYVYPGPICRPRTIAYVYPCRGHSDEKDPWGRFRVFLCPAYFRHADEQICTMIHEASHHTTACTDDVQYGAPGCKELARTRPQDALRNADSYGYFIREVARAHGVF